TECSAELVVGYLDSAAACEEIGNTSEELSSIHTSANTGASKEMVACVVVDLKVRRGRGARRQPHRRHDRRKSPDPVCESESGNIKHRRKDISPAGNDRATECRIEKILLRKAPGKNFSLCEEAIRNPVLHFIRVGDEIDVIDQDRFAKPVGPGKISIVDAGLDHMFPPAEVAFDLRARKAGRVLERKPIESIAHNLSLKRMRVDRLPEPQPLAPIKSGRAQNRKFEGRMNIVALHKNRRLDGLITPRDTRQAGVETPIERQCAEGLLWHRSFQCRKFPQRDLGLVGSFEKNSSAAIEHVDAQTRIVACKKSQRVLQRGRNNIEAFFVDLTER